MENWKKEKVMENSKRDLGVETRSFHNIDIYQLVRLG
jgi:hypothetical protein